MAIAVQKFDEIFFEKVESRETASRTPQLLILRQKNEILTAKRNLKNMKFEKMARVSPLKSWSKKTTFWCLGGKKFGIAKRQVDQSVIFRLHG